VAEIQSGIQFAKLMAI